jgi:hypothetical protein
VRGQVKPWDAGQPLSGVAINTTGTWSASAPGPTTGIPFVTPGGVFRAMCAASGFVTASGTQLTINVYIDGVFLGPLTSAPANVTNARIACTPIAIQVALTAGTHYWALQLGSGSSGSDTASLVGFVTPA